MQGIGRAFEIVAAFADPMVDVPNLFRAATLPLSRILRQMG